ncbi:rRNA maturation RNase YbeY [Pelagibacterales bacterium SAG-MED31]|nr:rRNA maturation RNase YbeY [Pelagibacterales bacterium SAG-MED31]
MKKKIETNFFCKSNHWSRRMKKIKKIVSAILLIDDCGFKKSNSYFLNLIFVNDEKIKMINKKYRNNSKSTDVLTFVSSFNNKKLKNESYCDIFFSAEIIKKDAKKNLINFYDHLTHLIIHCFLHINGYEHEVNSDFLKMKNLEKKILKNLGIQDPYLYE